MGDRALEGEWVLGYDVRVDPALGTDPWPPDRRRCGLLRAGYPAPLSVDTMVWSSLFGTPTGLAATLGLREPAPPPWIGPNGGLWSDQDAMARCAAGVGDYRAKCW